MSVRYETASGRVTERIRVDLTPAEAEAFTRAYEHIAPRIESPDWAILTGLERIAKAWRIEQREGG